MSYETAAGLIACPGCDQLYRDCEAPTGATSLCSRCGAVLYRVRKNGVERALALYLGALVLWLIANAAPFMSIELGGRHAESYLIGGVVALAGEGMAMLALLLLLTANLLPLLMIVLSLALLLPYWRGAAAPHTATMKWWLERIEPWSMVGIFVLGSVVALIKLLDLAQVAPEAGFHALLLLVLLTTAARSSLDQRLFTPRFSLMPATVTLSGGSRAIDHRLARCHGCGGLAPMPEGVGSSHCQHCHAPLSLRHHDGNQASWALLITAALLLIPANLYPMMSVLRLGQGEPHTIYSGVVALFDAGMWPIAMLILFVSLIVPPLKLILLAMLLHTSSRYSHWRRRDRSRLFRLIEVVGAWSMVDVYLVAILVSLVDLAPLARVEPGWGIVYFAAAVVVTLLAAHRFDPRRIWDERPDDPGACRA